MRQKLFLAVLSFLSLLVTDFMKWYILSDYYCQSNYLFPAIIIMHANLKMIIVKAGRLRFTDNHRSLC